MQQFFFVIITLFFSFFFLKRLITLCYLIRLGRPDMVIYNFPNQFKRLVLVAFGQSKMSKNLVVAVLHGFIYLSFLFIAFLFLETLLDGFLGIHLSFSSFIGNSYYHLMVVSEILAILAILSIPVFYFRRVAIKIKRLNHKDLGKKEQNDAKCILWLEFFSTLLYLLDRGALAALEKLEVPFVTDWISNIFLDSFSFKIIFLLERLFWWSHILLVFTFIIYIFHSKHLHIFLAFPTIFFSKERATHLDYMPQITSEARMALGLEGQEIQSELPTFGVKDIPDLKQSQILGVLSCTECGRCTDVCPANATGKKLSPRKIMMATRDRLEEIQKGKMKQKNLFDHISEEEVWACTTCMACIDVCPIMINPMEIIIDLRRYLVMETSKQCNSLEESFGNLETNGSPWRFNSELREDWFKNVRRTI